MFKKMACKIKETTKLLDELTSILEFTPGEEQPFRNHTVLDQGLTLSRIDTALTIIRDDLKSILETKHTIDGLTYLHDRYNLTEEEIYQVIRILDVAEVNIDIFLFNKDKVITILDMFYDIGVRNIFEIIITNPYMFYDTVSSIRRRIDTYNDKEELARLLNDDPENLELIHLA